MQASAQFTLKMCVAAQNCEKKSLKTAILGVQGRLRSLMLMPIERTYWTSYWSLIVT